MFLDCFVRGANLVVRPAGELDLQVADFFRNQLERHLATAGVKNLVLNLSKVSFIDSSGLGVILGRYRRVKAQGGKVAIVNAPSPVGRLLELAGLHKLVHFYASEEEALGELAKGEERE